MLRTAELRHLITLQSRVSAQDASGEVTVTFDGGVQLWAEEAPAMGREFFQANAQQNSKTSVFRTRYWPTAQANQRVVDAAGRNWHVVDAVNERGEKKFTLLFCVADLTTDGT